MISLSRVAMIYGTKLLFTDVTLNFNPGHRYGLVGANGAGKSTFLKLLIQDEEIAFGEINVAKNARIGCLQQNQFLYEDINIIDVVIAGNDVLWNAIQEKERLLKLETCDDSIGYRLAELEEIIIDNDGYTAEILSAEILSGLGIKETYHYQPLSVLSGGYKLRVLLAQSLFNNPDILLLDEPTNHLDIISICWLEQYLKAKFKGILIFISHDTTFLNNVATHILDIDYGEIRPYTGNYNQFVIQKAQSAELLLKQRTNIENKLRQMQTFVDKFRAGTRSAMALSREKQMNKIELPDIKKSSRLYPHFNFQQKKPSGKFVLNINNINKYYKDKLILSNVNFNVIRGEKIIIIGPNGVGKSTLLKIITDNITANSGTYEWGQESAISYLAQDHHEALNEDITVLEWLLHHMPGETTNAIRSTLGHMLFKQDDVHKNILQLSGGEGARLLLAKMMLESRNVLILDEPTNHLDIETKDALKVAIAQYGGTVILVTHDRDFASNIANRIIALSENKIIDFRGKYQEYLERYGNDYLSGK